MAAALKSWLGWCVRLAVTFLLLWLTLKRVPLMGIKAALGRVHVATAALSVAVFMAGSILVEPSRLAFAGHLLEERQPGLAGWIRIFMESRPFFYVLPGALASEGVVWLRLRAFAWRHASCAFAVLATRIWGVAIWGLAAAFALGFPGGVATILAQGPAWLQAPALWAAGGLLAAMAAYLAPYLMRRFKGLPVRAHIAATNLGMALSGVAAVLAVTTAVLLASRAGGTPIPFTTALGFIALFNFAMVLPVSLGGFGLQEAMVLLLGTALGYPAPALIAFSAVIHMQRLVLSLVGLGVFLAGRGAAGATPSVPPVALCEP